jgi:hypothetical protein
MTSGRFFKMNSFHYMDEYHSWLIEKDMDPTLLENEKLEELIYKFDKSLGLKWIGNKNDIGGLSTFDVFKIENKGKFFLSSLKYELFDFVEYIEEDDVDL